MKVFVVCGSGLVADSGGMAGVALVGTVAGQGWFSASPRQAAVAALCLATVALIAVAVFVVPRRRLPAPVVDQQAALAGLDPDTVARGRRLQAEVRSLNLRMKTINVAAVCLLGLTSAGSTCVAWTAQHMGGSWTAELLVAASVPVAIAALLLPFLRRLQNIYVGYGLLTRSSYLSTSVTAVTGVVVIRSVPLGMVCVAAYLTPQWWWAWIVGVYAGLRFVKHLAFPRLLTTLPGHVPLPHGPLRDRILALADRARVPVRDVLVKPASKRTTTVNAGIAGSGSQCRVVLFDTLLEPDPARYPAGGHVTNSHIWPETTDAQREHNDGQVCAIVAHELAHPMYRDRLTKVLVVTLQGIVEWSALFLLGSWDLVLRLAGVDTVAEPRAVGVLLAIALISNGIFGRINGVFSRRFEIRADELALELTGDPVAVAGAFRRLSDSHLDDPSPRRLYHLLFGTYPTTVERLAMDLTAREAAGGTTVKHVRSRA